MIVSDPRTLRELAVANQLASANILSQFRAGEKDALVFQSAALPQDTEVAGQMHLNLIVQSQVVTLPFEFN